MTTPECKTLAHRSHNLLNKYGITLIAYETLLAEQGGGCATCGDSQSCEGREYLYVDHDHATGEVRGLLCHNCNFALGYAKDDPDRLIALAAYLVRNNAGGL